MLESMALTEPIDLHPVVFTQELDWNTREAGCASRINVDIVRRI